MDYFFFALGFVVIIFGANFLVDGASSFAKRFQISELVIGMTIVAFGTSAPELVISVIASLSGENDIVLGNVLGSNIANILLILGIVACFRGIHISRDIIFRQLPFSLLGVVILFVLANDSIFFGSDVKSMIDRKDSFFLLPLFIFFMIYLFFNRKGEKTEDKVNIKTHGFFVSFFMIVFGLLGLFFGGKWIVSGATSIADSFGLSKKLVGLTIVAIGSSLPELVTSIIAAFKKRTSMIIGNIVGSNIFNIFWVIGTSSLISPVDYDISLNADMFTNIWISGLLVWLLVLDRKHNLERWHGFIFISFYLVYIVSVCLRG